jgi:hypothetical protein
MTAESLVAELEQVGVSLKAEGEKLKLQVPADKIPSPETIAGLRQNKAAVLEYLRERGQPREIQFVSLPEPILRKTDKLETWRLESLDAELRFGQPHARLFPFIGRKVRTPNGPGTLLQVFANRAIVLLDSERDEPCVRFLPHEVIPFESERAYA